MLYPVVNHTDTVEPVHVRLAPEPIHPNPRRLHDFAPFGTRNRFERAPECQPAPGFDLDERDQATASSDDVDLDPTCAKAMRHDLPPAALKIAHRLLFTGEPALMAEVGPFRRIAVYAARHGAKLDCVTAGLITELRRLGAFCCVQRRLDHAIRVLRACEVIQFFQPDKDVAWF